MGIVLYLFAGFFQTAAQGVEKEDKKYQPSKKDDGSFRAEELFQEAEKQRKDWTAESFRSALKLYEDAAALWMEEKRPAQATAAYSAAGEICLIFGDYQRALDFFSRAQFTAQQIGNRRSQLENLCKIAEIHILVGDADQAAPLLSKVEKGLAKIVSKEDKEYLSAILINRRAEFLALKGDIPNARSEFQKALNAWSENSDQRGKANCLLNLGYMNFDSGEIIAAEQNFEQALGYWQNLGDRRGEALTLTAQGHLYSFFDQSEKALNLHLQARDIFTRIGDRQSEAVAQNGAGHIYELLGLPVDAANSYYRALKINEELKNPVFIATTAFALARAYRAQKKFDEARVYYDMSLENSIRTKMKRIETYIATDLAEIDAEGGNTESALNRYREAISYYDEIKDVRGKALILSRMGNIYIRQNKIDPAEKAYREALNLNNLTKDNLGISDCWYYLAEIEQTRGNLNGALTMVEKSIALTDELHSRLISSTLKIAHYSTAQQKIELQIELLMRMSKENPEPGRLIEIFEKVEQSRARTLREILEESRIRPQIDFDSELFKQIKELEKKIAIKIEKQMSAESVSPADKQSDETEHELDDLRTQYERLNTRVDSESLQTRLLNPPAINLQDIQAGLAADTVYLSYFLGRKSSYLWLVTKTDIKTIELAGRETLETAASEFYQILTARQKRSGETRLQHSRRYEQSMVDFCPKGQNLSRLILGQIAGDITDKRLLVSLDGGLQYIPLDALPVPGTECRSAGGSLDYKPLLTANEVVYTPSFAVLRTLREIRRTNDEALPDSLAVWTDPVYEAGDERLAGKTISSESSSAQPAQQQAGELADLPVQTLSNTGIEAGNIAGLWPSGKATVFSGFDASRENITENSGNYRFLHIAAHGFLNNTRPQHSGLILSKFDERGMRVGSVLSLHDIFRLRLGADLVVLSACQTGLGENFSGEGLTGFKHAFFSAGANSAMISFWKVDDSSTAVLMEKFYRNLLKEGVPAGTALRRAKLEIYNHPGWEEPFFWAGFTLHGEYMTRGPGSGRYSTYLFFILALLIIAGTILGRRYYRKRNAARGKNITRSGHTNSLVRGFFI